jgi:integrase
MQAANPNDRVPLKKQANVRHAAACVAAISSAMNREAAKRFLNWKVQYDQRSTASVTFYAQIARDLDRLLGGRPFASTTHEDAMRYVVARGKCVATDGLVNELTRVKHFLKWIRRDAGEVDLQKLPYRLDQALTIRRRSSRQVKRERPIDAHEFAALMEAARDEADMQALYATCWESDARIGELLVLDWDNYAFRPVQDGGADIHIPDVDGFTKSGDRSPYVVQSVPYIRAWEKLHPLGAVPGTPIFTSHVRPYRRATYQAVRRRLIRHLAKAGIRTDVHFHLFRKTGATRRARTMDPDEFRAYHGWTAGSKIATQYIMYSHEQARASIRREAGLLDVGLRVHRISPGMKVCPACADWRTHGGSSPIDWNWPLGDAEVRLFVVGRIVLLRALAMPALAALCMDTFGRSHGLGPAPIERQHRQPRVADEASHSKTVTTSGPTSTWTTVGPLDCTLEEQLAYADTALAPSCSRCVMSR